MKNQERYILKKWKKISDEKIAQRRKTMQSTNLFVLTRSKTEFCTKYENVLADREHVNKIKDYEYIIFDGTYERQYDIRRYGDIWTKKSNPGVPTKWNEVRNT